MNELIFKESKICLLFVNPCMYVEITFKKVFSKVFPYATNI